MNDEQKLKQKIPQGDKTTSMPSSRASDDNAYIPFENEARSSGKAKVSFKNALIIIACVIGVAASYKILESKNLLEKTKIENVKLNQDVKNVIDYLKTQNVDNQDLAVKKLQLNQKNAIENTEIKTEKKSNPVQEFASKNRLFKGVLARCYIDGHDVHFTDLNGNILEHVNSHQPLTGNESQARDLINQDINNAPIIFIFDDHLEVFDYSGRRLK